MELYSIDSENHLEGHAYNDRLIYITYNTVNVLHELKKLSNR